MSAQDTSWQNANGVALDPLSIDPLTGYPRQGIPGEFGAPPPQPYMPPQDESTSATPPPAPMPSHAAALASQPPPQPTSAAPQPQANPNEPLSPAGPTYGPYGREHIEAGKELEKMGQANPSAWRTILSIVAQAASRRNPALGQAIGEAVISRDPNVRAQREAARRYEITGQLTQEEQRQQQMEENAALRNILYGNTQGAKNQAQEARLIRAGAEPIPTLPSPPVPAGIGTTPPPSAMTPGSAASGQQPSLPPSPPVPPYDQSAFAQGAGSLASALGAMPMPPPAPAPFANAAQEINPVNKQPMQIESPADQLEQKKRAIQEVAEAGMRTLPPEVATALHYPPDTKVPVNDYIRIMHDYNTPDKPEPASAAKQAFSATFSKLAAKGIIDQGSISDPRKQWAGLDAGVRSGTITQDEASAAKGYMAANPTPAQQDLAGILRMAELGNIRIGNYLDKTTGEQVAISATQAASDPTRYMSSPEGDRLSKQAGTFNDLQNNINYARNGIKALGKLDATTRAQLAYALGSDNPGALSQFMQGAVNQAWFKPEVQQAIIAINNMRENAMLLRGLGNMGQGSDQLRKAIITTLPSAGSPNIPYMQEQINRFKAIVDRLEAPVRNQVGTVLEKRIFKQPRAVLNTQQAQGKTATQADIQAYARTHNVTPEVAEQKAKQDGYQIIQ